MTKVAKLVQVIRDLGPIPTEDENDGLTILPPALASVIDGIGAISGEPLPPDLKDFLLSAAPVSS